jgi:hypothetical protein
VKHGIGADPKKQLILRFEASKKRKTSSCQAGVFGQIWHDARSGQLPWSAHAAPNVKGRDRRGPSLDFIGAAWILNMPKWVRVIEHQVQRPLVGRNRGQARAAPVPSSPAVKPERDMMSTCSCVPTTRKGAETIVVRLCL